MNPSLQKDIDFIKFVLSTVKTTKQLYEIYANVFSDYTSLYSSLSVRYIPQHRSGVLRVIVNYKYEYHYNIRRSTSDPDSDESITIGNFNIYNMDEDKETIPIKDILYKVIGARRLPKIRVRIERELLRSHL